MMGDTAAPARRYTAYMPMVAHAAAPRPPRVSARGMAGIAMVGNWQELTARAGWFHNWTVQGHVDGLAYVPFLWGAGGWGNVANCLEEAVRVLGRDYSGRLLWLNEPNDHAQANIRPEEAVRFYLDTKAAMPHAQLIGPNMSFFNRDKWQADANWLRRWHELVIQATGDAPQMAGAAVHNYVQDVPTHIHLHEQWRNLLALLGYDKLPLWVTEWGIVNTNPTAEQDTAALTAYYESHASGVAYHAYFINADPWVDMGEGNDPFVLRVGLQQQPTFNQLSASGRGWLR